MIRLTALTKLLHNVVVLCFVPGGLRVVPVVQWWCHTLLTTDSHRPDKTLHLAR